MILVVAWDGADLGVVGPWVERGELPHLAALMQRGATRALASTRPPVTFPAWTSFLTAATPDRHGISDFTIRDGYAVRFANARDRRLPTVFAMMSAAGLRVGTYGVPATYPPEALDGFQVPGFDTPFGASPAAQHAHPPGLAERILAAHGALGVEGLSQARIDESWYRPALERLLVTAELRTRIFMELLTDYAPQCAMIHYIESDTVSHQFRHFCDPNSPRYRSADLPDAMLSVYRGLDTELGRLCEAVGPDATVMLVSDHGSAATSDRAVFWNRWLADTGRLHFARRSVVTKVSETMTQMAVRWIPSDWHARLFARFSASAGRIESTVRFAGIDWTRTRVFSEELPYQAAFWVNLRGREPQGVVEESEVAALLDAVRDDLLALRDPFDGQSVVRSVWRREDLHDGDYAGRIPDLLVDLEQPAGCVYAAGRSRGGREKTVFRLLQKHEATGSRGTSMPGAHGFYGMCVLAGPEVCPGCYSPSSLEDAGATLLALAHVAPALGMNGKSWDDAVVARSHPRAVDACGILGDLAPPQPYSASEDRLVAERLRALGYIE